MDRNRTAVERSRAVLGDIKASSCFDLTTLCVALREIRGLVDSDH
jgi:NAD-specific glutamate dehydrogenase